MSQDRFSRQIFPASILCEGKPCLVVGGGKVAAHKTDLLLDAGARVTVVSPDLHDHLADLFDYGTIDYIDRPFQPSDIEGMALVFAATNSKPVNKEVLDVCRKHNILCCRVDGNWFDSDFVTPAILREENFTLAVSTGGKNCKRSRRLRENLRRHMRLLDHADLLVIGIDHHCVSVDQLEQAKRNLAEAAPMLSCLWGVHEFMVLSTCNRLELIGIISDHKETLKLVRKLLELDESAYIHKGLNAFFHVAKVAAGLHAQTLGEKNIVAQLKHALNEALAKNWGRSGIQFWTGSALHISKQIRQKVEPFIENMEIEDVCDQYLQEHCPQPGNTLIIGRGAIGTGMLQRRPQARQISGRDPLEIEAKLPQADIIVVTTGSDNFILTEQHRNLLKKGTVLVDLSMPRNIDPALPGVVGLADLKQWRRPDNLAHIMELTEPILQKHAAEYDRLLNL